MKHCTCLIFALFIGLFSFAQTDSSGTVELTGKEAEKLLEQIMPQLQSGVKEDALKEAVDLGCKCIEKISYSSKSKEQKASEIDICIDEEVVTYQATIKTAEILSSKNNQIVINTNENAQEYRKYYQEIQNALMEDCSALRELYNSENAVTENSFSDNALALAEYQIGENALAAKDIDKAAIHFKKAVDLDPKFVYAWDNLGLCYRHQKKFDQALKAYRTSLQIEPEGTMPLHNIPYVYEHMGNIKMAEQSYRSILRKYPKDPEGFYGLGRMNYAKQEFDNALNYACKAYVIYSEARSPYRSDAQHLIGLINDQMKKTRSGRKSFAEILKKNGINTEEE